MQSQAPILKKFIAHPNAAGESATLPEMLVELAKEVLHSLIADVTHQLRYGQLQNAPISVSVQQAAYKGVSHHVIVVAIVCPVNATEVVLGSLPGAVRQIIAKV